MPIPTLPSITTATTPSVRADVVVVGVGGTRERPRVRATGLDKLTAKLPTGLDDLALAVGAGIKVAETTVVAGLKGQRFVLVGLGSDDPSPADLRRAAGAALRRAAGLARDHGSVAVTVALPASEPETAQAVTEGALLGAYRYHPVSTGDDATDPISGITVVIGRGRELADAVATGEVVGRATATAREWINIPPNLLFPASFAVEAQQWAKGTKIAVEVLDERALERGGYGGLMAVGGGSARKPRLVRYSYAPRGAQAHIALIGKGITFDSGGLNIKPGASMDTMKCDMSGAATVLAATRAIAELGLPVKVTTYAAMAENLPSDTAYRPSDVLTIYGGTTVENGNCDAEGRLVMADALARSGEDDPDVIIDVATLTGACVVALGDDITGVMANDDELASRVLAAAEAVGEDFWQLPIPQSAHDKLSSDVADLKSTGDRAGGALTAAAFLARFVGERPWAHLDIAGPAFRGSVDGHQGKGGTGVAVATLVALARSYAG